MLSGEDRAEARRLRAAGLDGHRCAHLDLVAVPRLHLRLVDEYNTEVAQVGTLSSQKANLTALNTKLSSELGTDQAKITQLQNQLKVTMVNEVLFTKGGWTLNAKGEAALAKIAPTLSGLSGQQIVVEGFTDNEPIGPALKAPGPDVSRRH